MFALKESDKCAAVEMEESDSCRVNVREKIQCGFSWTKNAQDIKHTPVILRWRDRESRCIIIVLVHKLLMLFTVINVI